MKEKFTPTSIKLLRVSSCLAIICIIALWYFLIIKKENKPIDLNSNVYITAAHLDHVDGYTLMYKDTSRDVAYYVKNKLALAQLPQQKVKIDTLTDCAIISSSPGKFVVSTTAIENIDTGLSGTRVYSQSGKILGFIVSIKGKGLLECRTLE